MKRLAFLTPARAWWRTQGARDRRLLVLGGSALALFLVWTLGVQPAWRTLAAAPALREAQDRQWQAMQRLAAEAGELKGASPMSPEQSAAALRAATERLGEAGRLALQGERAVLTLNGASPSQLRDWLAEARSVARARPLEANLSRAAEGYTGTLVVALGGAL